MQYFQNNFGWKSSRQSLIFLFSPEYGKINSSFRSIKIIIFRFTHTISRVLFWKPCLKYFCLIRVIMFIDPDNLI